MGSLMRDPGRWILVENPCPPPPHPPHPPPSHLIPFHQRQTDRSPLHSPPIIKKLPKVKAGNAFSGGGGGGGGGGQTIPAEPPSAFSTSPVHLESFTEQHRTKSSILRRSGGPTTHGSRRRVSFDPEIVVHRFDLVDGRHVASEGQRLGSDQKDRKEFLNRNIRGAVRSSPRPLLPVEGLSLPVRRGGGGGEPPIRYAVPLPAVTSSPPVAVTSQPPTYCAAVDRRVQGRSSSSSSSSSSSGSGSETIPEVDFSFFEDDGRQLHLRLSVFLGDGVEAADLLVKANTAGNRVRVIGTRTSVSSSSSGTQEFAERYQLPMDVDPYRIRARMDGSGRLYLEAPVLSGRRALQGAAADGGPGFDSGFSSFVR